MENQNQNQKDVQVVDATFQNLGESVESRIEFEIQKFNVADATIAELKEKFKDLEISGIDDKKGMKAVNEAIGIVRTLRTGVEAKRKDLKNFYLATGKGIDAEAKRITELLVDVENPLKEKKQAIDDEIKRIEEEKAELEQKRLDERVDQLKMSGIAFDGQFYSVGNISVDIVTIKDLSDELFDDLKSRVERESALIAEQKRIADLQESRRQQILPLSLFLDGSQIDADFGRMSEDEFESLIQEALSKKSEFELHQKRQKEESEKLANEKRLFNYERNSFKLEKIGFEPMEDGSFSFRNEAGFHIVRKSDIEVDPESFVEIIDVAESKIAQLKLDVEKKRIADEQSKKEEEKKAKLKYRFESLKNAGLRFDGNDSFVYGDEKIVSIEDISDVNDYDFTGIVVASTKRIAEINVEANRRLEAEKLAKLPDVEKIERYCDEIMSVNVPALSTSDLQEELSELRNRLKLAVDQTLSNIKNQK